jgi:hypothetical protein
MYIMKINDPQGRANFDLKGYNLNNLGRGPLHNVSYQMPNTAFVNTEKNILYDLTIYIHGKSMTIPGVGPILNKFGRGPIDDII